MAHRPNGAQAGRGRKLKVAISAALVLVAAAGLLVWQALPTSAAQPTTKLQLNLHGSTTVEVGFPITIDIVLAHASDVAGYETDVRFNTATAHLRGLEQRQDDVSKLGRNVQTLGPIDLSDGVSFGAFSCPFSKCADVVPGAAKQPKGANGTVRLATFSIVADQPGTLTISLDATKFVDSQGKAIPVDLSSDSITVQAKSGS